MRKCLSLLLMLALVISCINVIPAKAEDATGYWVLTGHRFAIKEAVNDEYWSYDMDYDYNESESKVTFTKVVTLLTYEGGKFETTCIAECPFPKSVVKAGEDLKITPKCWVEGSNLDNMLFSNSLAIHVYDFDVPFREVDNFDKRGLQSGTGPNMLKSDTAILHHEFPDYYYLKEGDELEIECYQASGNSFNGYMGVIWTYKYTENYQAAPGKAAIKSAKVKKNTLTVTAKSIKCDGYQIQVSNSKDFTNNSETTLNTLTYYGTSAKATFDNRMLNKTKYIRVRAFYKNGDSVTFGEWSNVKKLTK
ncbi:MAG: hypothetical protein IK007_09380 [Lachnospiraceae bacterium]|nr:hypothetical protein [Lachnospiraceae bacterium]